MGVGQREVLRAANGVAQREEVDVDGAIVVDAVAAFCLAAQALLYVLRAPSDSWRRQRCLEKGYGIEKRVGRLETLRFCLIKGRTPYDRAYFCR